MHQHKETHMSICGPNTANKPSFRCQHQAALQNLLNKIIANHIQFLLDHQPISIDTIEISSGSVLDVIWAAFFATGEVKHVTHIMSVLPLMKLKQNDENAEKIAIGSAAHWSLTSNAIQHKKVKEICLNELGNQSDEIATILREMIPVFNK